MSLSSSEPATQQAACQSNPVSQYQLEIIRGEIQSLNDRQMQSLMLGQDIKCDLKHMHEFIAELRSSVRELQRSIDSEFRRIQST